MVTLASPDLTQHPPRSPRVRLGAYVHLPRLLDKARAFAAGKNGDYHYNCPLDGHFFRFTGIDHAVLLAEVKTGKSDTEMLAWVSAQSKKSTAEVTQWSAWLETLGPKAAGGHAWIGDMIKKLAPDRDDVASFSELLDLDDYVSFGGKG